MPDKKTSKLDKELQNSLKDIISLYEKEDEDIYKSQKRTWKKYEEFWHGFQYLFWNSQSENWQSPTDFGWEDSENEDLGSFSDKVIDIFRGHGESIISALAAQIPALRFLPDDADDDNDVLTARTKSKVADLIQRHNKAKMLALRSLFFLALQGLVGSYRYKDSDYKYGSYKVPKYGEEEQEVTSYTCKDCDYESDNIEDFGDVEAPVCPQCGTSDAPKVKTKKQKVPVQIGETELPKTRVKIDLFGPLHFKVRYSARNQSETPYLILYGDLGKDTVKEAYPNLIEEINGELLDDMSRFAKSEYTASQDVDAHSSLTVRKAWLRPTAFYNEEDEKKREKLLKMYPDGVRVTLLGRTKIFADDTAEELDKRWELGQAGLSTYIHSDPFMRPLVQIQEMRNQLVNLVIETIEHGIPSEFADPAVLNFDEYGKFEATPGFIYKAKPAGPGKSLGESFYTSSRATLSREVGAFIKQLDQDAQFSVGSFPSIYGGPAEGKTRTFSEYAASRQMALQRLSLIWNFWLDWWVRTIAGSVDIYIETISEDQKFVKYENNNYINTWIRQSELSGKTGGVEPEGSESFPVSLAQKKDLILKLVELNNDFINQALYLPENARVIQDVLALNELKLPGELQRVKQTLEIVELLKSGPIDATASTVQPSEDTDDHGIHIVTIVMWATDTIGLAAQKENPAGFSNVMAHLKQHKALQMMAAMQEGPKNELANSKN
jgi:hypothetical protein